MATDVAMGAGVGAAGDRPDEFSQFQARLGRRRRAKFVLDIALVWGTMVAWAPVCLAVAGLVRIIDGGPALFRQERVGFEGCTFGVWKFRTMAGPGEATTAVGDGRVTKLGRLLRSFHIDELPQLWNVAFGDMSLVGPRPEQASLAAIYSDDLADYELRHLLRPGMTGLAQISAPYAGNLEETRLKLIHDLDYLRRGNMAMDAWILAATPWVIWKQRGR